MQLEREFEFNYLPSLSHLSITTPDYFPDHENCPKSMEVCEEALNASYRSITADIFISTENIFMSPLDHCLV